MKRRKALRLFGLAGGAFTFSRFCPGFLNPEEISSTQFNELDVLLEFEKLKEEPAAKAEIRVERGGPRLFVNNDEIYPLFALSAALLKTVLGYKKAGINWLAPIVGLTSAWKGSKEYEWENLDRYFAQLLAINPDAYFLPRLHLNAPRWWKDAHPEELVKYGLPYDEKEYKMLERLGESGMNWNANRDLYDVSLASQVWKEETGILLRAYLQHIEKSPLNARMIGYQISSGMTAEWHYIGSRYLPDYSEPMKKACGTIPNPEARISTSYGLLRNPSTEREVIAFYKKFHQVNAEAILHFARIVKQETQRRVLCGTFYAYLLENVMIQEAGHLAPKKILNSPDIDFIPCPYT